MPGHTVHIVDVVHVVARTYDVIVLSALGGYSIELFAQHLPVGPPRPERRVPAPPAARRAENVRSTITDSAFRGAGYASRRERRKALGLGQFLLHQFQHGAFLCWGCGTDQHRQDIRQ